MKYNFPLQHTTNCGTYFHKVFSKVQEGMKSAYKLMQVKIIEGCVALRCW